ncbi:MAG: phosphopantothenoylcysteine decarboxylase, partial [Steroidobacteraceae bacterium]
RVRRVDVESAADMLAAVLNAVGTADIFISTAAVADYRPAAPPEHKIKKTSEKLAVEMERTIDVIASVAARASRPFVVGFAAETENVEQNARAKMLKKGLDMIAANEVGHAKAFDCADNELIVLWHGGRRELPRASKTSLARDLVALIGEVFEQQPRRETGAALARDSARA